MPRLGAMRDGKCGLWDGSGGSSWATSPRLHATATCNLSPTPIPAPPAPQAGWFPEWTLTEDFALGIELKKLNWQCRCVVGRVVACRIRVHSRLCAWEKLAAQSRSARPILTCLFASPPVPPLSYVNEYLAIGEAPEEVRNCFQQRSRWAKGHFQVGGWGSGGGVEGGSSWPVQSSVSRVHFLMAPICKRWVSTHLTVPAPFPTHHPHTQVFFSKHNPVFARGLSPLMRWMYGEAGRPGQLLLPSNANAGLPAADSCTPPTRAPRLPPPPLPSPALPCPRSPQAPSSCPTSPPSCPPPCSCWCP